MLSFATPRAALYLPGSADLKYRYCIFSGGKFCRWEGSGKLFRTLPGSADGKMFVKYTKDKFGKEQLAPQAEELSPMKFFASSMSE